MAEGVGQPRVALFAALVRNCPNDRITALVDAVVKERSETVQNLVDLVVLTMQTRDCRGGKGERDLSQRLFWELLALWPDVALKLIPLLPEYGSYRDLPALWHAVSNPDARRRPRERAVGGDEARCGGTDRGDGREKGRSRIVSGRFWKYERCPDGGVHRAWFVSI